MADTCPMPSVLDERTSCGEPDPCPLHFRGDYPFPRVTKTEHHPTPEGTS